MFGNAKGWVVSALIVVLTGGLIFYAGRPEPRSAPTGQLAVARKSAALPVDPKSVLPPAGSEGEAADALKAMAESARGLKMDQAFKQFESAKTNAQRRVLLPTVRPQLDELVAASKAGRLGGLLKADDAVGYGKKPYLASVKRVGLAAVEGGFALAYVDSKAAKDPKDSRTPDDQKRGVEYIEAAFQVGRMLYEDRLIFKEWRDGLDLMSRSTFMLATLAGQTDPDRKDRLEKFVATLDDVSKPAQSAWMTLVHPVSAEAPGDVFQIATSPDVDPMWRAEAILKLGRMKLMSGVRPGDQRDAIDVLAKIAAEPNLPPAVRVAVDKAVKLDADGHQQMDLEP